MRIMLRRAKLEHRVRSATMSRAELDVRKGDQRLSVPLEREQPGEPLFVEVLGVEIALESVDVSDKPSTARTLVRR